MRTNLMTRGILPVFLLFATALTGISHGQFVPAFPNAHFITEDPGPLGGPSDFVAEGTFTADDNGVFDVFVLFGAKSLAAPPAFMYSTTFRWENAASGAKLLEWVGNFNFDPPMATSITDTNDVATTPPEFELAADSLSATITSRMFPAFPFQVERYHGQISGLQPGETVFFQKIGSGAGVVPEPSSGVLLATAIAIGFARVRRNNRNLMIA